MNYEPSRFLAPNLIDVKDAGYVWQLAQAYLFLKLV
jgi:hypothetical protein